MAREVARKGITVNVVCPGPTDTPLLNEIAEAGNDGERVVNATQSQMADRDIGHYLGSEPTALFYLVTIHL